jgi:hypothetical protein
MMRESTRPGAAAFTSRCRQSCPVPRRQEPQPHCVDNESRPAGCAVSFKGELPATLSCALPRGSVQRLAVWLTTNEIVFLDGDKERPARAAHGAPLHAGSCEFRTRRLVIAQRARPCLSRTLASHQTARRRPPNDNDQPYQEPRDRRLVRFRSAHAADSSIVIAQEDGAQTAAFKPNRSICVLKTTRSAARRPRNKKETGCSAWREPISNRSARALHL